MVRKLPVLFLVLSAILLLAAPVFAQPPSFGPALYADGETWATQGVTQLPPPKGHNSHSFDKLFGFTNSNQLPVAEAAPGNPSYNGGRWHSYSATWNIDNPPTVTSYADLMQHVQDGELTVSPVNNYFECPLRPVKE